MKFSIGDKIRNRHRRDWDGNFVEFATVLGFDGCLMKLNIHGRSTSGLLDDFHWGVPRDWEKCE